jgi:hypothetical protein
VAPVGAILLASERESEITRDLFSPSFARVTISRERILQNGQMSRGSWAAAAAVTAVDGQMVVGGGIMMMVKGRKRSELRGPPAHFIENSGGEPLTLSPIVLFAVWDIFGRFSHFCITKKCPKKTFFNRLSKKKN